MYNISMVLFLFIFLSLSIVALLAVSRTRRYQLGQLAKQLNMTYENYRESITTVQTAGRLEFFTLFFRCYFNYFYHIASLCSVRCQQMCSLLIANY